MAERERLDLDTRKGRFVIFCKLERCVLYYVRPAYFKFTQHDILYICDISVYKLDKHSDVIGRMKARVIKFCSSNLDHNGPTGLSFLATIPHSKISSY